MMKFAAIFGVLVAADFGYKAFQAISATNQEPVNQFEGLGSVDPYAMDKSAPPEYGPRKVKFLYCIG